MSTWNSWGTNQSWKGNQSGKGWWEADSHSGGWGAAKSDDKWDGRWVRGDGVGKEGGGQQQVEDWSNAKSDRCTASNKSEAWTP